MRQGEKKKKFKKLVIYQFHSHNVYLKLNKKWHKWHKKQIVMKNKMDNQIIQKNKKNKNQQKKNNKQNRLLRDH